MPWYLILLSIMGTQASAITFLSAPGQAFTDGMRFVQYYFGLPIAMVVLCVSFVPLYNKLKVFTAYEFWKNASYMVAPVAQGTTGNCCFMVGR